MIFRTRGSRLWWSIAALGLVILSIIVARLQDDDDDRPTFLVTGDFAKSGDFSHDVFAGAKNASVEFKDPSSQSSPLVLPLPADAGMSEAVFRDSLLKVYTRRNVVGIISADISSVAEVVLKVANSYRLPVLLTVATNDKILRARREDLSFRLVPTDTKQAGLLAEWCFSKDRPVIIHGGETPYGQFLGRKVIEILSQERVSHSKAKEPPIITSYFNGTDLFSVLAPIQLLQVDGIVFIGYSDRFAELLGKLKALNCTIPILLSDGCYSPFVIDNPPDGDFFLSFPTSPMQQDNRRNVRANGVFGHDAYIILGTALADMRKEHAPRHSMPGYIRQCARASDLGLIEEYRFDSAGENEAATFKRYKLNRLPSNR